MSEPPRSGEMFIEPGFKKDQLAPKERNVMPPINGLRGLDGVCGL